MPITGHNLSEYAMLGGSQRLTHVFVRNIRNRISINKLFLQFFTIIFYQILFNVRAYLAELADLSQKRCHIKEIKSFLN